MFSIILHDICIHLLMCVILIEINVFYNLIFIYNVIILHFIVAFKLFHNSNDR